MNKFDKYQLRIAMADYLAISQSSCKCGNYEPEDIFRAGWEAARKYYTHLPIDKDKE